MSYILTRNFLSKRCERLSEREPGIVFAEETFGSSAESPLDVVGVQNRLFMSKLGVFSIFSTFFGFFVPFLFVFSSFRDFNCWHCLRTC